MIFQTHTGILHMHAKAAYEVAGGGRGGAGAGAGVTVLGRCVFTGDTGGMTSSSKHSPIGTPLAARGGEGERGRERIQHQSNTQQTTTR